MRSELSYLAFLTLLTAHTNRATSLLALTPRRSVIVAITIAIGIVVLFAAPDLFLFVGDCTVAR